MEKEKTLGERIKELREKKKLSLRELGSRVGLSAGYLSQIENNKVSVSGLPSEENLSKIAHELNVDETDLTLLAHKLSSSLTSTIIEGLLKGEVKKEQVFELFRSAKK